MRPDFADEIQEKLYEILCRDSCTMETLVEITGHNISLVMNALALMEIEGIIENSGGIYRID